MIAPLVIVHDQDGSAVHRYAGQVIAWLPELERLHLLGLDMVEEIPDATPPGVVSLEDQGQDIVPTPSPQVQVGADDIPRPPQVANKEAWVEYVVLALGTDRGQAEAMTKADLIALAG